MRKFYLFNSKNSSSTQGFTLIEILVSTAIFVVVVSSMLAMFNYTLQINRRVQSLREVAQGTRAFTETITREIRNGRIDYSSWTSECDASNYIFTQQSLAILARNGDRLCFYFDQDGNFLLKKRSATGSTTDSEDTVFDSSKFRINKDTFRFIVQPKTDPKPSSPPNPAIQPFVTIVAQLQLLGGTGAPDTSTINYQTTISTDVYDIYKKN